MKMKSITIEVSLKPRTVDVTAVSQENSQQYGYSANTRRAAQRLKEYLDKLSDTYPSDSDFLELNVDTDTLELLPES